MKWVESEADARAARDISIECMARIDHTIFLVRQSADDVYSARYTRASAMLMGEFVDIINRAGFDFSNLVPSEDEFKVVTEHRVPATELLRDERHIDADALRAAMMTVRKRVDEIATMAPRIIGSTMERYIDELNAAIDAWEARPRR